VFSLRGSGIGPEVPSTCHRLIINHLQLKLIPQDGRASSLP
jgi:hypothetical protein